MYETIHTASSADDAGFQDGAGRDGAGHSAATERDQAGGPGVAAGVGNVSGQGDVSGRDVPGHDVSGHDVSGNMVQLVTGIARLLVDLPDQVSLETVSSVDGTVLRLRVANGDIGKIIGKQGRTARSLRTIISAASMKLKHRFSLDIVEEKAVAESA